MGDEKQKEKPLPWRLEHPLSGERKGSRRSKTVSNLQLHLAGDNAALNAALLTPLDVEEVVVAPVIVPAVGLRMTGTRVGKG